VNVQNKEDNIENNIYSCALSLSRFSHSLSQVRAFISLESIIEIEKINTTWTEQTRETQEKKEE